MAKHFSPLAGPAADLHSHTKLRPSLTDPDGSSVIADPIRRSPFILEEELGKGSYAAVFVGTERSTRNQYAIKVYKKEKMNTKTRRKIIEDEVSVLQICRHKNIMRFYRKIETPTETQLVLQLVRGRSLGALLKSLPGQCLSEAQAKPLLLKLLDALIYLHANNIYHRDLKLDNILVAEDMEPTLIDFGFSCVAKPHQLLGLFCGTPNYMSPEIVNKKEYLGGPNDAWSFGVLVYRVLAGVFPFASKTTQELNRRIKNLDFMFPRHVSPEAKRVIESLLILEQAQRSTLQSLRSFRFFCS
jgi:MAP/microtubule affinity-regulating kinase